MCPLHSSPCLTSKIRAGEKMSSNSVEGVSHDFLGMLMPICQVYKVPWALPKVDKPLGGVLQNKTGSLPKARKCLKNRVPVVISLNVCFFYNKQVFFKNLFQKFFYLFSLLLNRWSSYEIACQIY